MIFGPFVLLLLVAIVGLAGYALVHAIHHPTRAAPTPAPGAAAETTAVTPPPPGRPVARASRPDLATDLARWVDAGLLHTEEAAAIEAYERGHAVADTEPVPVVPLRARRVPVVAEALGYLGGVLTTVGLALVVSRFWPDMATAGRLALSGAIALGLGVAGRLVHEEADPALARLRSILWLASTAAAALFAGVLAVRVLDLEVEAVVAVCAGTVALVSALLWQGRIRPLQQITCLGGAAVLSGALAAVPGSQVAVGLAVWTFGAVYVAIGLRRILSSPVLTEALGALALVVGSAVVADWSPTLGLPFCLATAAALLALVLLRPLRLPGVELQPADFATLGAAGGWTLLYGGIGTVGYYGQGSGFVGFVAWLGGALLVVLALRNLVRVPLLVEAVGGVVMLLAAAVTAALSEGVAPLFGIVTAVALLALGMRPGQVLLSVIGSAGLLAFVPWAIAYYFPGEGRVPLLIMVCGGLILAIAVLLSRMGDRFRGLGGPKPQPPGGTMMPRPSH